MVRFHAVLPYVPAPALVQAQPVRIAGECNSVVGFTRRLSCTGDFADPRLNQELRRFLMRDALSLVLLAVACVFYAFTLTAELVSSDSSAASFVALFAIVTAALVLAAALDGAAYLCGDHRKAGASRLRYVASIITAVTTSAYIVFPTAVDVACTAGYDLGVVNGTATNVESIERRQRYCFDRVNPWLANSLFSLYVLRRVYPQHGVPLLAGVLALYVFGVLFVRGDSTPDSPRDVKAGTVVTDVLVQLCVVVVSSAFCVRFHGLGRDRFIATVEAERARHLSIAEMREVDGLLQRALPPTVLARMMAAGVEIRDVTESATVAVADVAELTAYAQVAGQRAAVHALHALVSAADDAIAGIPNVEKIKTAGDSYYVASGLPEAFDCHASAVCRFGQALMDAAARLSATAEVGAYSVGDHSTDDDDNDGEAATVPPTAQVATIGGGQSSGSDGWRGGALRLCVGVHCGSAFGGVLGTQRLSYEVYGGALDGAQVAVRHAPLKRISITDATRRRLAVEAALYAAETHSAALFATANDVHDATEQLDDVDSGALVLYALTTTESSVGNRLGEVLVRNRLARADAASVATHSVETGFIGNGSLAGQSTAEWMLVQRAGLELRLEFILQLAEARKAERTILRKQAGRGEAAYAAGGSDAGIVDGDVDTLATDHRNATVDDAPADTATAAAEPADAEATKLLAMMEDAVNGPFKRGSRVPLVFSFADDDEERGYIEWVREHTHELRRDMRFASLLLYAVVLGCYVGVGGSDDRSALSVVCFATATLLGAVDAGFVAARKAPRSDQPLAFAAFGLLAAGVLIGNSDLSRSHVVTNDGWWLFPVQTFFIDAAAFTISPLLRTVASSVFALAPLVSPLSSGPLGGDVSQQVFVSVMGNVTLPYIRYLFDKLLRSAFIETRVAALLRLQQDDARRAREVMLLGLVPPHVVRPLQRWLKAGTPEPLAEEHAAMAVCHMSLRGFTAPAEGGEGGAAGPGLSLLDAHRAVDAILDTCPHLTKVRMSGHSVTLAGPFPPANDTLGDGSTHASSDAQLKPQLSAADLARRLGAALCDALRVVAAVGQVGIVVDAGIDVGPVVGAVVGSRRLSYDVHGPCVMTAQRVAESLVGTDASTDVGVGSAFVKVALTTAACALADSVADASSPRGDTITMTTTSTSPDPAGPDEQEHEIHLTLARDAPVATAEKPSVATRRIARIASHRMA